MNCKKCQAELPEEEKSEKTFEETLKFISGNSFLLGLDVGMACKCHNTEEAVRWVKHNFRNNTLFIDTIDSALQKQNKCLNCNRENSYDAIYCSNCGEKLKNG